MKKLLFILTLFILNFAAKAQYPITQNLGSDSTLITVGRNSMGALKGGIIPMSFTDTTAANLTRIKLYGGALIWTTSDSSLWVRNKLVGNTNNSGTQYWFKIGGAGGGATGSFWNLTGNTIAAVPAGFGIGTNSADNLPFKTDNTTRLILPSTGLARQSGGAWKSMMFDTTNFTWGYGDGTNIYNSDGTLSGTRTVTTGGNEINFYTDASNYFKYTPSTQGVEALMTNGNYSTYFNVDAGNGVYMYGKDATVSGNGGFVSAYSNGTELELSYNGNITGLLNNYKFGRVYSLLATENPYVGVALDSANGVLIGRGTTTNRHDLIRGLRVLPDWQIYMDSIDAGGTANDSVLVVQADGKVVRRNASALSGLPSVGNQGEILQVSNGAAAWKYDTTTLVTFSAGARLQADTAMFTDSTLYGSFYLDGNDTLIITGLKAVMNGGTSDTLGIQITYNDTINVTGSNMFTSTLPINSTTVGSSPDADDWTGGAAPFKIPPGNWVWLKSPTVVAGRKPYYLSVSIIGYKKRLN